MVAKTILIADGGSTKTDWSIVSGNWEIDRIRTGGINPFFQTEEEISAEIRDNLIPRIRESDSVGAVYFYGAGCAFPEKNEIIRRSVTRYLPVPVEVGSDLLAAARALCGALLVFWGLVPTPVCMTERVLSRAYLRWALSWEMRGVAPYLENCWLGMC